MHNPTASKINFKEDGMIELINNSLKFSFPEIHPEAKLSIDFQRTLRIPDNDKTYPLPPGLGRFPLKHVDDYSNKIPESWNKHGGVMLPMYQSEALWIYFRSACIYENNSSYPFAIKVATGKTNAITGNQWDNTLISNPQNYLVSPQQPWLDGYCAKKGIVRQFVAIPLGEGYTAEEQLTGEATYGGIQIQVYPMKRELFDKYFPKNSRKLRDYNSIIPCALIKEVSSSDMGLAPGGKMEQEIYDDPYKISDWEQKQTSRCFVHIANSQIWSAITGDIPPTTPPLAKEYSDAGLPWFEYYNENNATALNGSEKLSNLKTVTTMGKGKGEFPLPENDSNFHMDIIQLGKNNKEQVREGNF